MDYRHLNDRFTTLDGTLGEYDSLQEGLVVLRAEVDTADVLGQNTSVPGVDYVEELAAKLPADKTDPERRLEVTVDVDELTALCSGLRLAVNHATKTRAVFGLKPDATTDRLNEQITKYRALRRQLLPGVRYNPDEA